MLQRVTQGPDKTIGQQNPQKGTHQGRRYVQTQLSRRATQGFHGDDDPHHRRHNTKTRQGIRHPTQGVGRMLRLLKTGFDVLVHQGFQLKRRQVARGNDAQIVADEFQQNVLVGDAGITIENITFAGVFHILLDGHQTVAAGLVEQLIEQRQQIHIQCLAIAPPQKGVDHRLEHLFHHVRWVRHNKGTKGGATDDQQLKGLPQGQQLTVGEHIPSQHTGGNNHESDKLNHMACKAFQRL